jgi:hypothetical protein
MTELVGILVAWWRAGGILSSMIPLALALIFALSTTSSLKQSPRAILAVMSLLAPLLVPILLPSSRPFATLDWIVVSISYIGIALTLSLSHVKQVKNSLRHFFEQFDKSNQKQVPREEWLVAEGLSSFKVLIFGIYGLAALLGSITCYLYIGVTRRPEGFIFQNNEGFIAALSLLIIVLAGAAVPIYTELAKQVRTEIDLYESQISSLQQTSKNVGHHAEYVWTHFERVARMAIREWSSDTEPKDIASASHLMLFMPFNALFLLRSDQAISKETTFVELRDEIFKNFLADEPDQSRFSPGGLDLEVPLTSELLLKKMPGAEQHYFKKPEKWSATSKRVLRFLHPDYPEENEPLNIVERRHRARRLTYLGWSMQGPMAIAQARNGSGNDYVFAPNLDPNQPLKLTTIEATRSASWEFQNSTKDLLPATEELFVALLQQKYQTEYKRRQVKFDETPNIDDSKATTTFVNDVQEEYKRRAARHIQRWSAVNSTQESGSLARELASYGDSLDLDISTLSDDLQLFRHFYIATNEGMNQGADARFLYYSFWLLALTNAETKISQTIAAALEPQTSDIDENLVPQKRLETLFKDLRNSLTTERIGALRQGPITPCLEFTLLTLADQKSALYNWLRAAKSVTTRQNLEIYEKQLDTLPPKKQLGIEVIPIRQVRLEHLRQFLDIPETQPPLTVRSVFDLLPVDSPSISEQRRQRVLHKEVYGEYRSLVELLQVSKKWGLAVAIDNRYTRKVVRIDSRVKRIEDGEQIDRRADQFLRWILRVLPFDSNPDKTSGISSEKEEEVGFYSPLWEALLRVSPTFFQEIKECAKPASSRQKLSDEDRTRQLEEIRERVSRYCLDPANAADMKETFFGGADPATREKAETDYNEWLAKFRERAVGGTEGK